MYNRCGVFGKDGKFVRLIQTNHNLFETRRVEKKEIDGAIVYGSSSDSIRPKIINGSKSDALNHLRDSGYVQVAEH